MSENGPYSPGWYQDPTGRHRHRFWDGDQWTDQARDDQAVVSDPLAAQSVPTNGDNEPVPTGRAPDEAGTRAAEGSTPPVEESPSGDTAERPGKGRLVLLIVAGVLLVVGAAAALLGSGAQADAQSERDDARSARASAVDEWSSAEDELMQANDELAEAIADATPTVEKARQSVEIAKQLYESDASILSIEERQGAAAAANDADGFNALVGEYNAETDRRNKLYDRLVLSIYG